MIFVSCDPSIRRNILNFFLGQAKRHILWLEVCVDNVAYPVEVVKSSQTKFLFWKQVFLISKKRWDSFSSK